MSRRTRLAFVLFAGLVAFGAGIARAAGPANNDNAGDFAGIAVAIGAAAITYAILGLTDRP